VLIKLEDLDRRLQTIERVVQNQSLVTMTQQLSALERRVDELQGGAEEIQYNASTTYERQRELYADLDARIQSLESALQARGAVSVMEGGNLPCPYRAVLTGTTTRPRSNSSRSNVTSRRRWRSSSSS
jgi:TolA-binding protein